MKYDLQQQFFYCFTWSGNQFLVLKIFSFLFLQTFLFINSISLCFDPWIFCHLLLLANLFLAVWLFVVLFWMLWMLVTVCNICYVPHTSRITSWGTMFTEIFLDVSKEWVRSWSHAFLITTLKTLAKKLLAVHPEKVMRRKKRKNN